jgi:hypothetical protein
VTERKDLLTPEERQQLKRVQAKEDAKRLEAALLAKVPAASLVQVRDGRVARTLTVTDGYVEVTDFTQS